MLRFQSLRKLPELVEVQAVVVASLLVRLAQLRVSERVQFAHYLGQLWIWHLEPLAELSRPQYAGWVVLSSVP